MPEWLQWLTSAAAVSAFAAMVGTYLKTRPAMKAAETDGEVRLRTMKMQGEEALWERLNALQAKLDASADECDKRIERLTERHDAAMSALEAEIRVLRHDRNNVRAGFNALLAMIKRLDTPELSGIAETVEEMVARGDQTIAIEKAAIPVMKGNRG